MPLPPLSWSEHLARRAVRRELAERTADVVSRCALLRGWGFAADPTQVAAVGLSHAPPEGEAMDRITAWALHDPAAPSRPGAWTETTLDLHILNSVQPASYADREREIAAWVLLGRLGDEVQARERTTWQERVFAADHRDEQARALWETMLAGRTRDLRAFPRLYADAVRKAVQTVLTYQLQLPASVVQQRAKEAIEAIELLPWDGYLELAARVIEAINEPVAAMAPHLGAQGGAIVAACVRSRAAWREAWESSGRPGALEPVLASGLDLHVARRVAARLVTGAARAGGDDLPEWETVRQNRSRARGRLRAVLARDSSALKAAVLAIPQAGLFQRTAAALRALAVEWTWRTARRGLAFDVGSYRSPACTLEPEDVPPIPVLDDDAAVRTALLNVIARGHWTDLERWLEGGSPRHTLYRALEAAAHRVGDGALGGGEQRGYRALREALEGRLEGWETELRAVAWRVAAVPEGPDPTMRGPLHQALTPDWDEAVVRRPERFLRKVRGEFLVFGVG